VGSGAAASNEEEVAREHSPARIIIESLLSQVDGRLIAESGICRLTFREERVR
jgi:hypothetical protein